MHQNAIDLLDAGMTDKARQARRARKNIERQLRRGKISVEDLELAFRKAGDAFIELAEAMKKATGIIVDSISTTANRLKPMLDAVKSDNFEDLLDNFTEDERRTLRALRQAAFQVENNNLPKSSPRKRKDKTFTKQKFAVTHPRAKKAKQHHRRRR